MSNNVIGVKKNNNYTLSKSNNVSINNIEQKSVKLDNNSNYEVYDYTDISKFDDSVFADSNKNIGATIANAYFSMGEGVAKFGGALVDTLATLGSVIDSSVVELFGNHELAERLRSDTQAFVAESYVSNYWDKFYETTAIGNNIKEKSYGFATTRQIGNGIGYTVGIVVTCVLTAGVGGALSGGATTVGVASTEMSTIMAAWGGIAGFGKGADEAWREGSGYWTGLGYASLTAGWEALQFYLGGKINGIGGEGAATAKTILTRIALDTVDGGAEGFVQPALQAIFRSGYTDLETEEYKEFEPDTSFVDKFMAMWNEQGGWNGVITNAAIGGILSTAGEAMQYSFLKNKELKNQVIADGDETALIDGVKNFFSSKKNEVLTTIDNQLTLEQNNFLREVNEFIKNNPNQICPLTSADTSSISSQLLDGISDLSKVEFIIYDGLKDINNPLSFKPKYMKNYDRYIKRITYTGFEMKSIISEIERLQSYIDINLPESLRARQVYDVIINEIAPFYEFNYSTPLQKEASQSLRGITSNSCIGKKGLVCAGYASLYKELCERVGLACDYVRGTGISDAIGGGNGGHAWNIVYTNEGAIPVDLTWKACNGSEDWFGVSYDFIKRHIPDADELTQSSYSTMVQSKFYRFIDVIDQINKRNNAPVGLEKIDKYITTGEITAITRNNGARDFIKSLTYDELNSCIIAYNKYFNKIDLLANELNKELGLRNGYNVLNLYIHDIDISNIKIKSHLKNIVTSMDKRIIDYYLSKVV